MPAGSLIQPLNSLPFLSMRSLLFDLKLSCYALDAANPFRPHTLLLKNALQNLICVTASFILIGTQSLRMQYDSSL